MSTELWLGNLKKKKNTNKQTKKTQFYLHYKNIKLPTCCLPQYCNFEENASRGYDTSTMHRVQGSGV